MSARTFLYTVHTRSGIRFLIEADNLAQAETRARDLVILRTLIAMLRRALSEIDHIEPYREPKHLAERRLIFRAEVFRKSTKQQSDTDEHLG